MSERRGRTVTSSMLYKLLENGGAQCCSFLVNILLARLLTPSDYGVLAMMTLLTAVSQVFVQSGLNTALIQKKDADEKDLSSAFYTSLAVAAALYALLFGVAPWVAAFFQTPELTDALRVLALLLPIGALTSVQQAVVARRMAFRSLMLASLGAVALSGVVGVSMAYAGLGYWALVGQQLVNQLALGLILLITVDWRPKRMFSLASVRALLAFGWKLFASSLLDTVYQYLRGLAVGKKYGAEALGYYNRGRQFPELLMNAINGAIQSVMLPALSREQDDRARMKAMMRRSVMVGSYLVFPLMTGLALVAEPLVSLLLTDRWLPCVPYLQVFCLDYAFYPIHTANLQAINAQGRSDVFLRLELIKKAYGMVILLVTVFCFDSVLAIAVGGAVSTLISSFVNAAPNKKLLGYSYLEQIHDLLPSLLASLAMGAAVWAVGFMPLVPFVKLLCQAACGVLVYYALSRLFRLESYDDLMRALRGLRRGRGEEPSHE